MSVQAATAGRQRIESMLGYAQALPVKTIQDRRLILAGCPVTITRAVHGSLIDVLGDTFTLNLADLVIEELVAALNVQAVVSDDSEAGGDVWDCWQRSELAAASEGLFTAAAADGQAFLIVDFDAQGQPTAWVNASYDGKVGVEVKAVDPDGALRVVVKHEQELLVRDRRSSLLLRLTDWFLNLVGRSIEREAVEFVDRRIKTEYLYDPETDSTRLRYFVTDPGKAEYQAIERDGEWVAVADGYLGDPWPYGMPVIPFVAPGGGELVELEDPQRLVNTAALDLASAARVDSLRIVYSIDCAPMAGGVTSEGKTGANKAASVYLSPGVAMEFRSLNSDAPGSIGVIPSSDLTALMEALKLRVEMLLLRARTSTFILPWKASGTVYPSGAALRIAQAPFADKVERYQERWSASFARLFTMWQRMLGLEPQEVLPVWRPLTFSTRTEDLQDVLLMQQIGLPRQHQAGALGLTPEQLNAWEANAAAVGAARLRAIEAQTPRQQSPEATPAGGE